MLEVVTSLALGMIDRVCEKDGQLLEMLEGEVYRDSFWSVPVLI